MIEFVDPIPPVVRLLNRILDERVYGNKLPVNPPLPCVLVKNAGGVDYTRLLVLTRANTDIEAMNLLYRVMNILVANAASIELRGVWVEKETNPNPDEDADTGKPEAWVYMRMEHLEV